MKITKCTRCNDPAYYDTGSEKLCCKCLSNLALETQYFKDGVNIKLIEKRSFLIEDFAGVIDG